MRAEISVLHAFHLVSIRRIICSASSIHATAYLLFLHSTARYSSRGATSIFPLRFVCCVAWQLRTCSPSLPSLLSGVAPFENIVVLTPQVGSVFVV